MSDLVHLQPNDDPSDAIDVLDRDGVFVFDELVDGPTCDRLAAELQPHLSAVGPGGGLFYGRKAKRVYAVIAKAPTFGEVLVHPSMLAVADAVLGPNCDRYRVHLTAALETWPGGEYQPLHRDEAVYGRHLPYGPGQREYLLSMMFALTDFTEANGATRLELGSHVRPVSDPPIEDNIVQAAMSRGSVAVWLGSVTHGMGQNTTDGPRTGISSGYSLGWLRQEENQYLACPPGVARDLPERVQQLLGYQTANPSLGFADGLDSGLQTRPGDSEAEQVALVSAAFETNPRSAT